MVEFHPLARRVGNLIAQNLGALPGPTSLFGASPKQGFLIHAWASGFLFCEMALAD
jgi:hypothetical protein